MCVQYKGLHTGNANKPTIKYGGGSLMLCRCFVAGGLGTLRKINDIMNSAKNQDILA